MKNDVIKSQIIYQGISFMLLIIIIPLQITILEPLQHGSSSLIISLQHSRNSSFTWFISCLEYITPDMLHYLVCPFILNFFHPLRVPKTILFYCLTYTLSNLLTLLFQEGRPFWYNSNIKPILCLEGFGNPSYQVIIFGVVVMTITIEYLHTYTKRMWVYSLAVGIIVFVAFGFLYLGENYPHQMVTSLFFAVILITVSYSSEKSLIKASNRCCYKYHKNRVSIIYWVLACFSIVCLFGAIDLMILSFTPESPKMINDSTEHCPNDYNPDGGLNVRSSVSVFYIFGYITGALIGSDQISIYYSMTAIWKRTIRFAITSGCCYTFYFALGKN